MVAVAEFDVAVVFERNPRQTVIGELGKGDVGVGERWAAAAILLIVLTASYKRE